MSATMLSELEGFEPIESGQRGCEGCAFEGDSLSEDGFEDTACHRVACFESQFPNGHLLAGTTKSIIWVRKEAQ